MLERHRDVAQKRAFPVLFRIDKEKKGSITRNRVDILQLSIIMLFVFALLKCEVKDDARCSTMSKIRRC